MAAGAAHLEALYNVLCKYERDNILQQISTTKLQNQINFFVEINLQQI